MTNPIKAALFGAVSGGLVGWLLGTWYVDNYMQPYDFVALDHDNTELEEVITMEKLPQSKVRTKLTVMKNKPHDYTNHFDPNDKPELAALAAKYNQGILPEAEDENELSEDEVVADIMQAAQEGPIEIIDLEDFANSDSGFTKHHLTYYIQDDVLTDDHDEPIRTPERVVGEDTLFSFGELSGDPDTVYVRNLELKGEYEIVRVDKSYSKVPALTRGGLKRTVAAREAMEGDD